MENTVFNDSSASVVALPCVPPHEHEGGVFNGVGALSNEILILIVQVYFSQIPFHLHTFLLAPSLASYMFVVNLDNYNIQ